MGDQDAAEYPKRQHVVMLVNNPCVNDSRVIKSAEAVAKAGRRVTVVCRQMGDLPIEEERAGVSYLRIKPVPRDLHRFLQRLPFVGMFLNSRAPASSINKGEAVRVGKEKPVLALFHIFRQFVVLHTRSAKRFVVLRVMGLLRSLYWLFETDEFGTAAEPYIRKLAPDVIHAHDLTTLPFGGRAANASGARLIYDSHELEMHRNATYPSLVNRRRRQLEGKYIRRADRVITVSESIAEHLRDDYSIPRPCVVMNAPLFDKTAVPQRDLRSDLNFGEEVPLAVYVGSVTINRGIEQIIRALVHAPELHFATIGPRRPVTEEETTALAVEIGVRDRLHFVDPVKPEEVVGYIRTADVSVLPIQNVCLSYYYCMPNKLLESVFAGLPVAVANLLEMRRFVEAHNCGVVMDETDPKDIARALSRVVSDRESYILSEEAREKVVENYGWPGQADRLCALYDSLEAPAGVSSSVIGVEQ